MSYGPELIWISSRLICSYLGKRVQKVDGGDKWCAVTLSGGVVLMLSWGPQNYGAAIISEEEKKIALSFAKQTPTITNAIKSHLVGSELVSISQINRDRVLKFSFKKTFGAGFSAPIHLILEAMDRFSNLILTDDDNIVIETVKHVYPAENPYRSILPGQKYILPPEYTGIAIETWINSKSDNINNIVGVGKPLLKLLGTLSLEDQKKIIGTLYSKSHQIEDFLPIRIGKYITALTTIPDGAEPLEITLNSLYREMVLKPLLSDSVSSTQKIIARHIQKEITRREKQIDDLKKLLNNTDVDVYKTYGDLIIANIWKIKTGDRESELMSYGKDGNKIKLTVPLDPSKSAAQNAEKYFKKYKKIISSQEHAAILLEKVETELSFFNEQLAITNSLRSFDYLLRMADELGVKLKNTSKNSRKTTAAQTAIPPHQRFDIDGSIIYVGLSAKGNRFVTFKLSASEDLWFHVQGIPGAHVILRLSPDISDEDKSYLIRLCASFAVRYCKGSGNDGARVDYTQRKYVTPIKGGVANVTYREFSSLSGDLSICEGFLEESQLTHAARKL